MFRRVVKFWKFVLIISNKSRIFRRFHLFCQLHSYYCPWNVESVVFHRHCCDCWPTTFSTSSSSSQMLAEKSGLGGCDIEGRWKVGVACRPPCVQKRNISPRHSLNLLRFLVFDSETADHPVYTRNLTFHWWKIYCLYWVELSSDISCNFCKAVWGKWSFPLPNNRYPAAFPSSVLLK